MRRLILRVREGIVIPTGGIRSLPVGAWCRVRAHEGLTAVMLFVLLIVIILCLQISAAKPGDIMFFPKLLIEQKTRPVDGVGPAVQLANAQALLRDRAGAYSQLAREGECVQLLLARAELEAKITQVHTLAAQLAPGDQFDAIQAGYGQLAPLANLTIECEHPARVQEVLMVWAIMLGETGREMPADIYNVQITERSNKLSVDVNALKGKLRTAEIDDQDLLNQVNELVLFAEGLIASIGPMGTIDEHLQVPSLYAAQLAVEMASDLLESEKVEQADYSFQLATITLCMLREGIAEECEETKLISAWASINSGRSYVENIKQGKLFFLGILTDNY